MRKKLINSHMTILQMMCDIQNNMDKGSVSPKLFQDKRKKDMNKLELIERQLNNKGEMGLVSVKDVMSVLEQSFRPVSAEWALQRINELNKESLKKFKPSLDNISGQRAGYIQCLMDLGMLEKGV